MAQHLTFKSWQRSKLFDLQLQKDAAGRLEGKIPITIADIANPEDVRQATDDATFRLMAAGDVAGLKPTAIRHMAPAPFTRDAETTKLVHIDFWEPSLPWRYTPEANAPGKEIRPWMVLLVGTGKEIQVLNGIANVDKAVLLEHDLRDSHLWAHVQFDGNTEVGRILSPRGLLNKAGLLAQHQYVAVLVPAFNNEGNDMWSITGPDSVETSFGMKNILPAFHSWQFMTAEGGDFETLTAALHLPPAGDVGKAILHYRRNIEVDDVHINQALEIRGAITSLQQDPDQQGALDLVLADIDLLNNHLDNSIGLPEYGLPWLAEPDSATAGWPSDVNDDARYRGIAGLGLWMGIAAQESLVEAAVTQAGALREAGQRINNLALGLLAAGSLWSRHLPTDKNERLRILGPMMGRMLATGGGMVLDKITQSSPLAPALFSSAAQRMLRDRSVQTRHLSGAKGGINSSEAIIEANQPEALPERVPHGLPHIDAIAKEMGLETPEQILRVDVDLLSKIWYEMIRFIDAYCEDYREKRDKLAWGRLRFTIPGVRNKIAAAFPKVFSAAMQPLLSDRRMRCEVGSMLEEIGNAQPGGQVLFMERVLEEDLYKQILIDDLWKELCKCVAGQICEKLTGHSHSDVPRTFCDDLISSISPPPSHHERPVDLDKLSDLIFNALDPRQADAPAKRWLCATLQGIDCTRLIRPEFEVGLDFPTWSLLKKYDKEWLLPGVNGLEKDSVLALQTNPKFIDAFMLGINTQFMSEMRWRDIAVNRSCTPLRMFWGQVNYATGKRQADIQPLAQWAMAPADALGALSHQTILPDDAGNTDGNRLVIVFRSDLFRRYPSTLVYLVKPTAEEDVDVLLKQPPVFEHAEGDQAIRNFFGPMFAGVITPEISFFSFDVRPLDLEKYWLVLDEPPAELRFRNDKTYDKSLSAADFAVATLDQPTRVAMSGTVLENLANQ